MKMNIEDLRYWPILNYLPASILKNVRLVYVFGDAGSDVLLATNDDELLVFGYNSLGCLAKEKDTSYYNVDSFEKIEALSKKRIKGFAFCSCPRKNRFVLAYLESGEVYSWGYNNLNGETHAAPSLIDKLPKTVTEVSCGKGHILALTSGYEVFGWGDNTSKQVTNLNQPVISNPVEIGDALSHRSVVKISCGFNFSVVVTDDGEVFSWGQNNKGQLGLFTVTEYEGDPQEIVELKNIIIENISCGSNHVLALDNHGGLFTWGCNAYGQGGCPYNDVQSVPLKVPDVRYKEVAAHDNISIGVSFDGSVDFWGRIGGEYTSSCVQTPCRTIDEAFALFGCGKMYKPIEIASENKTVSETIRESFGNPEDSDFKFIVQGRELYVHKTILKLRSQYFKRMFQEHWQEGNKSSAEINENYEAMVALLKYFYTNELKVDPRVALDLSIIADKYCESNLVNVCLRQFQEGLNDVNLAELYELSYEREMTAFIELCIEFASNNMQAVMKSEGYRNWKLETLRSFFQQDKIIQVCGK